MSALFAWSWVRFPSAEIAARLVREHEIQAEGKGRFLLTIVPDPDARGMRRPAYSLHETQESVRAAVDAAKAMRRG